MAYSTGRSSGLSHLFVVSSGAVGLMALVSISLLSTALSLVGYLCKLASANLAGPVRPN